MEELNLSDRLRLIAGLIKKGSKVADIGTDHGYLPIFLVKSGITDRVIAMDVRKGPLKKAEDNTRAFCVSDQIELRLSDGLAALEKGEADKIYLNFSDPWPKARHAKRRLTSREFLARYDKILVPDGKVEFKTDNKDLFEFSLEEVKEAGWNLEAFTFDLHHNEEMVKGNVMTEYEEKFSSMGNPICKMVISRQKTD